MDPAPSPADPSAAFDPESRSPVDPDYEFGAEFYLELPLVLESAGARFLTPAEEAAGRARANDRLMRSGDALLAALDCRKRRVIAGLPDRERSMMLMRGMFGGGHPRSLVSVARAFNTTSAHVLDVERAVMAALGSEWLSAWRRAHEVARARRRPPYQREIDRLYYCHGAERHPRRGCAATHPWLSSRRSRCARWPS